MIGRIYIWDGRYWVLRARGAPFDRGPRRNVLLECVAPFYFGWGDHWFKCIDGLWWRPDGPAVLPALVAHEPAIGERVVRPFRGLRRAVRDGEAVRPRGPVA